MILECAVCRTRYLVPDIAIGAEGRTVRCANCKHSWHQPGADPADLARAVASPVAVAAPVAPAVAAAAAEVDAFGYQPPFRPRRNPARRYTIAAAAAAVAMLTLSALIVSTGAPGLAASLGIGAQAETPLRLVHDKIDRRDLDSGGELFAVSGRVVNPSNSVQKVPDIRAELRDAQGRLVFSWTIAPPKRQLAPRQSAEFYSAQLDVPNSSKRLDFSFSRGPIG